MMPKMCSCEKATETMVCPLDSLKHAYYYLLKRKAVTHVLIEKYEGLNYSFKPYILAT